MTTAHEMGYASTSDEAWKQHPICLTCLHAWPCDTSRYEHLVRAMIAADQPCPAQFCDVSMLGHLISGLDPELVALVRALDPDPDGKVR